MTNTIEKPSESKLTSSQTKTCGPKFYSEDGRQYQITAKVRYDDRCRNGHNSFSITGEIYEKDGRGKWRDHSCGCLHDEIAKHFPELEPFIKWHLCSSDEPMHYVANTVYLAGERGCWGLLKGEFRQHTSRGQQNDGVAGVPNWILTLPVGLKKDVYSNTKPEPVVLEWQPCGRTGEGKESQIEAARNCAIWPEATQEQLLNKKLLVERLPALMAEFRAAVESLGFVY